MTWHDEIRNCDCGTEFQPKREAQRHCSTRCRVAAHRERSVTETATPRLELEKRYKAPAPPPRTPRPPSERTPPLGVIPTARHQAHCKATTTSSNMTRTAIPSCQRVLIEDASRKPKIRLGGQPGGFSMSIPSVLPRTGFTNDEKQT